MNKIFFAEQQKRKKFSERSERWIFVLYLTGFFILAFSMVLTQPLADTPSLANPPDEHARYLIPKYICEHGVIPTGFEEEVRIPSYGFSYGLYNVFPYIVQGYIMRFFSIFTDSELFLLYVGRMVNVIFGLCMAVVIYKIGKKVFEDDRFRWLFCFAVMYMPQSMFMHTYINTDSCNLLAVSMIVYGLICGYQEGFLRKNCLWLSGGIILCALSYYNSYGYILSSILLFVAYFINKKNRKWHFEWKEMLKKGIFISVIVLLGISWWFIRSAALYDGDFLGLATREKMASIYAIESVNPLTMETYQNKGYTLWQMMEEGDTWEATFYTFVASFGSVSINGSIWLYRFFKVFFAAGFFGILYALVKNGKKKKEKVNGKRIFFHFNMFICILIPVILMIYYSYTMDYQPQGRYLLPMLIPFMYYMVYGIQALCSVRIKGYYLSDRVCHFIIIFFIGGLIVSVISMVYVEALPVYFQTGIIL